MDVKLKNKLYTTDLKGKFLFIRHGETICNSDEDSNKDLNPIHIDSHLSDIGIEQCKKLQKIVKKFNIEKVYASPLYRSLQTAKIMLENNENFTGKIEINPLITECPNSIDDLIENIEINKKDFEDISDWNEFDKFNKNYNGNFFYFEFFNRLNEKEKKVKYKKLYEIYKSGNFELLKQEIINEIPRKIFVNNRIECFESFKHACDRFNEFRKFLKEKHKDTLEKIDDKVLVVTHSDLFAVVTSETPYNNDDIFDFHDDCYDLENCEIVSIYI